MIEACRRIAERWWVMQIGGEVVLEYGIHEGFLAIFPTPALQQHRIAFGLKSKRIYERDFKGSGLRVKWPAHEPHVCRWAEWLGVRRQGDWAVL